jgi:hypothetical protein
VVLAASFEVTQAVTGGSADQAVTLGDGVTLIAGLRPSISMPLLPVITPRL